MANGWEVVEEKPNEGFDVVAERRQKPQQAEGPTNRGEYYLSKVAKWPGSIAAFPGLAVDAMNQLMGVAEEAIIPSGRAQGREPVFPVKYPFLGSQNIRESVDSALDVPDIPAPSAGDEMLGFATEMLGPSLPFSVRNIASSPHKIPAFLSETGSMLGATVGGTVGEKVGGEKGKMIGTFVGGTAPAITPTLISKGVGAITSKFSKEATRDYAEREAGKILKPAMESELSVGKNMDEASEFTKAINSAVGRQQSVLPRGVEPTIGPQFRPTIGARTGAEVVQELEAGVSSRTPQNLARYARREAENAAVLEEAKRKTLGTKTAESLPRQASSRLIQATERINSRIAQMERQQKAIASGLEGESSQQAGEGLRNQYWTTRQAVKGEFDKAYGDLYSSSSGTKIDMTDVGEAVRKIAGADQNVYQDMPRTFGKIKREMGGEAELPYPKPTNVLQQSANDKAMEVAKKSATSFEEFHSLWKEVNRDMSMALRSGDSQRYEYLKQLKSALDNKVMALEGGGLGELSESFRSLNTAYKTRYAKVFKEGIGGKVASTGRFGATVDDAKVVERFFTPDGIDDFIAIYGNDKNAQQLLKDGVLGLFSRAAVDELTGKIKPSAAEAFIRRHAESLRKLPDLDRVLRSGTRINEALVERSSRMEKGRKALDTSVLQSVSKSENIGELLSMASKSPKEMKQLFALAKSKQDRAAMVRSLADELPHIARAEGMEPYKYLLSQEQTLKPILDQIGKNHWENLRVIAGGQTLQGRMNVPGRVAVPKPKDELFELTGSNARSIIQTYLSVARGRTGPHGEAAQLFGRFAIKKREQMIDAIMDDAIYDADLAEALAKVVKGRPNQAVANKLGNWLQTNAFRAAITHEDEEEQKQPEKLPEKPQAKYQPAAGGVSG